MPQRRVSVRGRDAVASGDVGGTFHLSADDAGRPEQTFQRPVSRLTRAPVTLT